MSIGFLGVNSSQKTIDVFSGNASSVVDKSLQGTLANYDSIRTDISRLVDNAVRGSFDISSQQYYNSYNKEAITGWAETWYSEYKAVLALRADALQKKLQAAYNRVLEKSAYAEIKPNSDSVFAPYANRTFNVTDTNYKMPVSEIFYKDVTAPTVYSPDPVTPPNTTPVNWTQRIRETIQSWGNANDPTNLYQGSGVNSPTFDRNLLNRDGDDVSPLSDTSSRPNGGVYYNDPRIILGLTFRSDPDGLGDEVTNSRKYNNVASPILRRYISTSDAPANNSVYRVENTGYNAAYNGRYYRFGGTTYNFGGAAGVGIVSELTAAQRANLLALGNAAITSEITLNWTLANTGGILDVANGQVLDNREAARLRITAGGGKIQTSSVNGRVYNVATNTAHTRWMVDPTDTDDITGDGIAEAGVDFARLRDGTGYGLFIENYAGMNDKSTAAGDPNFGHIDSTTHPLVNPLLWDGLITNSTGGATDPYELLDSRREAFAAVARNAQVDAAVKAIADTLNDPVFANFPTQYPEEFETLLTLVENNIRDNIYAPKREQTWKDIRDFIFPFGTSGGTSHPWFSERIDSPYYLGIDYNSVQAANPSATTGWKSKDGLYTAVRNMFESQVDPIMNPPPAPSTGGSAPSTEWSTSYYDQDLDIDAVDADDRIGNPKKYIPQFGMGDIDWSALPGEIYDTLLNDPQAVGAIQMAIADINKTFVGKQFNDIIGASKYTGDYWSSTLSVMPGPLQLVKAIDEVQSLATGGSAMQAGALQILRTPFSDTRTGPNIFYGHISALSLSDADRKDAALKTVIGGIPTIGMLGTLVTLPIPYAPITMMSNTSYDLFSDIFVSFMNRLKKVMVEGVQVQSYGASSGTAFDTYASRAEYHFSEPGFSEAMKQLKIPIIPGVLELDFGEAFNQIMFTGTPVLAGKSLLGSSLDGEINNVSYQERLFDYKHSVQGAESRETDTGAFFATNAFLSQFELEDLDYEYWIGTQQNEEYINMDMQRTTITAGKELLNVAIEAALTYATSLGGSNPYIGLAFSMAKTLLTSYINSNAPKMIYNFLYKDQNLEVGKGIWLTAGDFIKQGKVTTEAYDYIEPDKKPYEGDSDFNYPPNGGVLDFLNKIFTEGTPDFILDGYASTMRFRKAGGSAASVQSGGAFERWTSNGDANADGGIDSGDLANLNSLISSQMTYNQNNMNAGAQGLGPRALAGQGADGHWVDTALGDINEVYVGSRKVSFDDLSIGFNAFTDGTLGTNKLGAGSFGTQEVDWELRRYTGSTSRVYNNRYNAADPVNHESFSVGTYSGVKGVDGATGFYDRRNQYSLSFKSKYDNTFSLFGSQALNPTIGGGIKIAEIDKNKLDTQLLEYEQGGITAVKTLGKNDDHQQFGAGPDGSLNDLNKVLYEHLHLRADGLNLSTINEYRDVFNSGFLKNIFVSGQTYHPAGGGITSSIQVRYDTTKGTNDLQSDTREYYDNTNYDPYNTPFLTRTKGKAEVYLSTYFAYKKRAGNKKA